jgi:hypothetical protein
MPDTLLTPPAAPQVPATPPAATRAPDPRRVFLIAAFAAILGLVITLSFGYADHDPRPHDVPVAVVAAGPVLARLSAGLERAVPGGFVLVSEPTAAAATASIRAQATSAALIVSRTGNNTIVTAGAQGTLQSSAITQALSAASAQMGRTVSRVDVVPLTAGDQAGLGSFVLELGLLIPSVIGSVGLFIVGARFRLWWRVAGGVFFALLAALGGTLTMDTIFGALTGNGGALIGIGFLGAACFVLFVAACQAVVGLPGTALAALAFIFTGNAISGGSIPVAFLPDAFRQIAPWLPNNAIVRGVRDVIYYHGTDLGHPLLVLMLWPAVALVVLIAVDAIHLVAGRETAHPAAEIYSTSALTHLRRRRRGEVRRPF